MLFDKDEDGVLSFTELEVVMKCLGQRPSGDNGSYIFITIIMVVLIYILHIRARAINHGS